jgi:hypothetical protein
MIYQHRCTTDSLACLNIFPSVSDHETCRQVEGILGGSLHQEAGERLSTGAAVPIVVVADQQLIERQRRKQRRVDRLHDLPALGPTRHVRLVRDSDQAEAGGSEGRQRARRIGHDFEIRK